jgi:hypothetical protein
LADRSRSGLATAFFSLMALSFGMIGAALMLSAAQTYRTERASFERWSQDLALEGVSNIALARLLVTPGDGPFQASVADEGVTYSVRLEREDLKQSLALTDDVEPADRARPKEALAQALFDRLQAAEADCLFQRVSPVAGGDRSLQDEPTALGEEGELSWRSGQRWRIAVSRPDGRMLSRWLLLSGYPGKPGLELMRARGRLPKSRPPCDQPAGAA